MKSKTMKNLKLNLGEWCIYMKITIRGDNPISGDDVKRVLDNLSEEVEEIGVTIKNMTLYIRFLNAEGKTIDLVDEDGDSISRTVTINTIKKMKEAKNNPNVIDFNKIKKSGKDKDK